MAPKGAPRLVVLVVLLALIVHGQEAPVQAVKAGEQISAINAASSPIRKVVTLIQEMKDQVEKEGEEDQQAYDAYKCWCETNAKKKTKAIEDGTAKIAELESFLEEAGGKEGELKTEIGALEDDIAEDTEALETATALREKEHAEFESEESEMKETIGGLVQAVKVLSKVQLLQKQRKFPEANEALLQVRNAVRRHAAAFRGTMQKDLFDLLGSLEQLPVHKRSSLAAGAFLGEVFLPKREAAALEQRTAKAPPWEKTEEQLGKEAKPNDLVGAAGSAKSYNSRSGQIFGILSEMRDEFGRDLAAAQKEELDALVAYQHLRAAKIGEIEAATEQKEQKEAELAELLEKIAQAKEDIDAIKSAVAADQKFLADLQRNCAKIDEEFEERGKVRTDELQALAETLTILTADDARDLFSRTISFLQFRTHERTTSLTSVRAAMQDRASQLAMRRLMAVAKRHQNWSLAAVALRVRLDKFTKVKEAMDKMTADLRVQQKEEFEKWEFCKKEMHTFEDQIKITTNEKEDLIEKNHRLASTIEELGDDITNLKTQIADMEAALKKAGENRKTENQLFQSSVADQRAATEILNMALVRLQDFYVEHGALLEVGVKQPGQASSPEPPKPKAYSKSASAGGVLQMISKVIADAEADEHVLVLDEQSWQEDYASYAKDTATSIEADLKDIARKEEQLATAEAEKSETEEAQLANGEELTKLGDLLNAMHLDCDFLLKYFHIRQKAREEELDSISDAKAILSGADFGWQ